MKSYTDLKQSKVLAEILSHESADMYYKDISLASFNNEVPNFAPTGTGSDWGFPCWSLAALLNVLPILERKGYQKAKPRLSYNVAINKWIVDSHVYTTDAYDNPVDACVAMIEKLHELKML